MIRAVSKEAARAMDQAFSRRPVTAEAWVQSQAIPGGICGGQSCTRTVFSSSNIILAVLQYSYIHLSPTIYYLRN